jgi:CheY-like chemotaxis protein
MPKMGGLELLRYLRTLRPNLGVVILTAYGTVGSAVEAMKLGAVDFMEKPFDPKVLLLLCEEVIQGQKLSKSVSVDDLLHLAELARERRAYVEARVYLKTAMMREVARPEPYYWLGYVSEAEGDKAQGHAILLFGTRCQPEFRVGTSSARASKASWLGATLIRESVNQYLHPHRDFFATLSNSAVGGSGTARYMNQRR